MVSAPESLASDVTVTLPAITDTLATKTSTDVFQNKDLTNANNTLPTQFQIACSDMTTAITTGTSKAYFRVPFACTITGVRASAFTAPTGSTIIIDINDSGSTIMTTNKLSLDTTEKTSVTAATAATITDNNLTDDAEITIDFDQVGSTVAGAGIIVTLYVTY